MSALAELDRYIKENEITLYSINLSKLSRNSFAHTNKDHKNADLTNRSLAAIYRVQQHGISSVENELNNFITRLKQMQQIRLAQLQQVNALFVHDMAIEEQFDVNVATAVERNEQTAEEEFEAFLLGESKLPDKNAHSKVQYVPPPPQSTLFSKQSLAQDANKGALNQHRNGGTNADSGTSKTNIQEEDLVSDDAVVRLKKNRRERSAQLRSIVESITLMGLDNTDSENISASAANRSGIHKDILGHSHTSREAEEKLASLRRSVLDTSHLISTSTVHTHTSADTQELPPPPPPARETERQAAPTESSAQGTASRVAETSESSTLSTTAPAAAITSVKPAERTAQPSHTSAVITLQSILDDEQFDVAGPYMSATDVAQGSAMTATVSRDGGRRGGNGPSAAHPVKKSKSTAAAPFLVSNIRRKSVEQGLTAESEQDLSMSTIHSNPYSSTASNNQHKNMSAACNESHTDVVGIGFGDRYGERAVDNNNNNNNNNNNHNGAVLYGSSSYGVGDVNPQLLAEEACEISSIGSQDSGSGESGHFHLSSMRRSGNKLFEYADQLESPVKRKPGGVSFATDGPSVQRSVAHAEYGIGGSTVVTTGDTRVNESIRKAAQFTHHVSDYYEHRMRNLEASGGYAGSPKNVSTYASRNEYSREFSSPERPVRSRMQHEYDSPTPKTPTFAPIFS